MADEKRPLTGNVEYAEADSTPTDQVLTISPNTYGSMNHHEHNQENVSVHEHDESATGSHVTFHDITYIVPVRSRPCLGKVERKVILDNVSGTMRAGMNAILGPTGSGKTSLLDVLAGRKDPRFLQGTVLIDGQEQPENFKCMSGYVVQDDVVMGTLTVRENFHFSASLRLPRSVSKLERSRRVDDVVHELGLGSCADMKVGTEFIRGVSGGERKRTNIGMELIIGPRVLFLDEPTTGLDASTANAVMLLLHRLARAGRTIIFSIHQPRYSIYKLFDSLMLLSLGKVVYHGASEDALRYFEELGFFCEPYNNPPDFFLDVINGDSTAVRSTANRDNTATESAGTQVVPYEPNENKNSDILTRKYLQSMACKNIWEQINPIYQFYQQSLTGEQKFEVAIARGEYATSFCRQFNIVSRRTVLNLLRNPQTSILQVFVMVFFAIVVGVIYLQLATDLRSGVQNRVGAFFFLVMNMVFGNLSAIELFLQERVIFRHENSSGFYRVSAYFIAKVFCDVLPMRAIPVIVFSAISYWLIGLQATPEHFFFFTLDLMLTTLAASSLCFFVSASVSIFAIANLIVALCYVFMMVFSGLLINLGTMADWISWIKYLSIFRYSMSALSINELKDMEFCDVVNGTKTCMKAGNEYLKLQGIDFDTPWDLWLNEVALGSFTIIFLIGCYIQLLRMNKYK